MSRVCSNTPGSSLFLTPPSLAPLRANTRARGTKSRSTRASLHNTYTGHRRCLERRAFLALLRRGKDQRRRGPDTRMFEPGKLRERDREPMIRRVFARRVTARRTGGLVFLELYAECEKSGIRV